MGMSASQARLLSITARINDIEFKSQSIANIKVRLADESEQLAQDYSNALNRQKITFTTYSQSGSEGKAVTVDLDTSNLAANGYKLVKVSDKTEFTGSADSATMYAMIESGEFILQKKDEDGNYNNITVSGDYQLNTAIDNSKFAIAEAEYNAANMKIKNKEKLLDNEMKKLDTEHSALNTEMDSVKNLIGKNVEKSFNLFA